MNYICNNCGAQYPAWEGKCSACDMWGTIEENSEVVDSTSAGGESTPAKFTTLSALSADKSAKTLGERVKTGFDELDRVLGGGLVKGEVILMSGEPGIGKSTLLLQLAASLSNKGKVLYISGEESAMQLKSRADRIGAASTSKKVAYDLDNLLVSTETVVEKAAALIEEEKPVLAIIDSIQSMHSDQSRSYAGSIAQVRISGSKLTVAAKNSGVPIVIVGQINKEGMIAGPKVLEHAVDCVLYMEGDEFNVFRILRGMKNRFGPTNEIGVFEMRSDGMHEVANPSNVFIQEKEFVSGTAIGATLQGSRVVFVEVQALTVARENVSGPLKRVANGIKRPRLEMLCAVLSRRAGVFMGDKDVFVNIAGGINVDDPGLDMAIIAAIKSSVDDKVLGSKCIYVGEVGLTGGIRSYFGIEGIANESYRLGYESLVIGKGNYNLSKVKKSLNVKSISSIREL